MNLATAVPIKASSGRSAVEKALEFIEEAVDTEAWCVCGCFWSDSQISIFILEAWFIGKRIV